VGAAHGASDRVRLRLPTGDALSTGIQLQPGDSVLEIGCGVGYDTAWAAGEVEPAGRAIGMDRSAAMVMESARRHRDHSALVLAAADAAALPLASGSIDACFAIRTLLHVPDPGAVVGEVARVLRPGGQLVVVDMDYGANVIDSTEPETRERVVRHNTRQLSPTVGRALRRLFLQAGLVDVEVTAAARTYNTPRCRGSSGRAGSPRPPETRSSPPRGERLAAAITAAEEGGWAFATSLRFTAVGRAPATLNPGSVTR
jgi:SAM-dependent methyltransferase